MLLDVLGLGREPDEQLPGLLSLAQLGQHVRRGLEHDLGHPVALLELLVRHRLGPEVGDRGRHDDHVRVGEAGQDRPRHVVGGVHPFDRDPGGVRGPADRGDERDGGAPSGGALGHCVPHLPGRPVPDEPNRVDRLACPSRRDQHTHSGEVARFCEHVGGRGHDALGLGKPAGAGIAAGKATFLGIDHVHAPGAQHREVLLDGGVLPHLGVHRRREQDGRLRRQQRGGEEIVGDAVRVLADDLGGGGRHDDQVRAAAEPRVRDRIGTLEE